MASGVLKRQRELRAMCEAEGCTLIVISLTRGQHYKVNALHGDKGIQLFTGSTPSDKQSDKHLRATLRRQIREPV